jgi:hypothetical protein
MAAQGNVKYRLVYDEPAVFMDERGIAQSGRRLGFRLDDGTILEVHATMQEYKEPAKVKAKLKELIDAHMALYE